MRNPIVIYGSTGHALAVHEQLLMYGPRYQTVAYIDDINAPGEVQGVPVISFETWAESWSEVPVLISIGMPAGRRRLAERIAAAGGRFVTLFDRVPPIASDFDAGEGTFVGQPAYIGPNVRFGRHVQMQPMAAVGHDSRIGDFVTICACHIAGWVLVEDDVFVGIGSVIIHGNAARPLVIGRGAVIGAGAVVMKSVPPGAVMVGNPARDMSLRGRRAARRGAAATDGGEA
ncbi:hypothetical protein FHR90_000233 [Endobacter medicaginis]|uniref:PglD N-terminal domain-containing protein n=2 Tax=Endobacter medicaginis TaxID=1181271 RepID=A0A839URN7_9PROT|nr:acetyltransferase [Endobacter medicaginis]MBB3172427.1 hypothetical protein [Endobacter medicaginis]MCX5474083.1 hypothetical protein [Endobacter medicaginis]